MATFYGWGSTASRLQPLRGGSLLFTVQFPEILGTHFIDLGRMKGWADLGLQFFDWPNIVAHLPTRLMYIAYGLVILIHRNIQFTTQTWQERKRQARGHHSPSSIHGEWLAIDDQKNNILASLCFASYLSSSKLAAKARKKHCVY